MHDLKKNALQLISNGSGSASTPGGRSSDPVSRISVPVEQNFKTLAVQNHTSIIQMVHVTLILLKQLLRQVKHFKFYLRSFQQNSAILKPLRLLKQWGM